MDEIYGNSGYNYNRLPYKLITIELDTTVKEKTYQLVEPIVIDQLSDIFIDSFITFHEDNSYATTANSAVFIMGIKDFNMKGVSNGTDSTYYNKIVIPNTYGPTGSDKTTIHKENKFNFVSTINPTTLSSLTISLTNNNNGIIGASDNKSKAWVTFYLVARD